MNKKYIIVIVIIIALIILVSGYVFFNRTILLSEHNDFKKIYNKEENIENIQIGIMDIQTHKITPITNKDDIKTIIDTIKNEKIISNVSLGETTLGGAYLFLIKNISNNNTIEIDITSDQMTVNNKTYTTENNLKDKLTDIYLMYVNSKV